MVIKVNKLSSEQINFYPLEIVPTAPPELVVNENMDSNFRIAQIMQYRNFLNSEKEKLTDILGAYRKIEWGCFIAEVMLVILDIVLCSFGILNEKYIISTSSFCIFVTALSALVRSIASNLRTKKEKQQMLLTLASAKLFLVKDKYDLSIRDGNVDHTEYTNIVDEFRKYEQVRNNIMFHNDVGDNEQQNTLQQFKI